MGLQVYIYASKLDKLIQQTYVELKDSLDHGFTGLQVYISASKLDKTLDENCQPINRFTGIQVYGDHSLILQTYVVPKDSLEHGFTGVQVYISAGKLDKTWDEMFKLYLCLQVYWFTSVTLIQ